MVILTLTGCSIFTTPTGRITLERQQLVNTWAKAKVLYGHAYALAAEACRAGEWPIDRCASLGDLDQQARRLALEVDAKLAVPESEINWAVVEKLLGFAVDALL